MEATTMNSIAVIKKLWDAWDVRIMILSSLFLQIILFILGSRRKYLVSCWIEIVVWLAYLGADSVAIAALGKLSTTNCQDQSDVLRGLWAPLLLVHLGGPDTITAMALEDNKLWLRHLLVLTVEAILAIYVIVLSWTRSWLSILSFPLFLAGIIKYLERTWCLYQARGKNPKEHIPLFDTEIDVNTANCKDPADAENIVLAHFWLAVQIPDISSYLCTAGNLVSSSARLVRQLRGYFIWIHEAYTSGFMEKSEKIPSLLDFVAIQHGLMFDMLYTKAAIIYTNIGCALRLISFSCSLSVSVVFLISFTRNQHGHYSSGVDIFITGILLVGAVALEIYALFLTLSSDWALLLRIRYQKNRLVGGIFQSMDWLISKHQAKKRWSRSMGQFDLLRYCISSSKRKPSPILRMIGIDEMLQKLRHRKFRDIIDLPLKEPEDFPPDLPMEEEKADVPRITRGEKALKDTQLIKTVRLDFDHSILVWHIATNICYCRDRDDNSSTARNSSRILSDYMMYLFVMKPSMVSPNASVWFDDFSSFTIKKCKSGDLVPDNEITVFEMLLHAVGKPLPDDREFHFSLDDRNGLVGSIIRPAQWIVSEFETGNIGWDGIKSVWLEKLNYAAINSSLDCHLQELRHGGEFLTLYRLMANHKHQLQFIHFSM